MRFTWVATLAAVGLLLAGCGGADKSQTSVVRRVVVSYIENGENHCCVEGLHVTSVAVDVSHADPAWAAAGVKVVDVHGKALDAVVVVLHRVHAGWRVFNLGTAAMGCGVPKAARKDLELQAPRSCRPGS